MLSINAEALLYLLAGALFIISMRGLSSPETARLGNVLGMTGMGIAMAVTIISLSGAMDPLTIGLIVGGIALGGGAGALLAFRVPMTSMPQTVGLLNSFGGIAAVLVSTAAFLSPMAFGVADSQGIHAGSRIEMSLGIVIGAITFSGSIIAAAKLHGKLSGNPIVFKMQHLLNLVLGIAMVALIAAFFVTQDPMFFWGLLGLAFVMGILMIIPIGGADMPVVIAILNSYSGWAGAVVGFTLDNPALIITGSLVGSSGAILSYIMCKAMNRSFFNVMLGGFGGDDAAAGPAGGVVEERPVKRGSAEDAAFIMKNAGSIIIVPGYGMAVAQAQHALKEMAELLTAEGVDVKYAIHPVAGRMPGHMNVLLAEANVSYDDIYEMDDINTQFAQTDVAFVIGANDVTNPSAKTDPSSPIAGMPVLDVENAKTVLFVKRSLGSGYAGVGNELFFRDNTMMLFSDAKKMVEDIVKAL